jgi:predicted ATPase
MRDQMIHIQKVHIEGYKSILDAEVGFLPGLNVIIGKNGAGKSNLLKVLDSVLRTEGPSIYAAEIGVAVKIWKGVIQGFHLRFDGMKPMHQVPADFSFLQRRDLPTIPNSFQPNHDFQLPFSELVLVDHSIPNSIPLLDIPISFSIEPSKGELSWLMEHVLDVSIPQFSSLSFATLFVFLSNNINPENFGSNGMELSLRRIFESALGFGFPLMDDLIDYTPIEDIRINWSFLVDQEGDGSFKIRNLAYEFKVGEKWYDFGSLSDGTKRMIYVIFSMGMPRAYVTEGNKEIVVKGDVLQKIILFEEPEIGIHPHQLHQLLQFLKAQARKHQIIITTHSPQVLDIIGKNDLDRIIIASYDPKQGSKFEHLNEAQRAKAQAYLKDMLLSDFWRFSNLEPRTNE